MVRDRDKTLRDALRERTTLRVVLVALALVVVGFFLLFLAYQGTLLGNQPILEGLANSLGDLLIASVAVSMVWELAGKRAFVDELLSRVRLSSEVQNAGLTGITVDFNKGIDWTLLFANVRKLDIFFAYAHSWRSNNHSDLLAVARRRGARVRVVLPDPDDESIVSDLARRFNSEPSKIRENILEAEADFRQMRPSTGQRCASISLWYLQASPQLTLYRFDNVAIIALYKQRHELVDVPTFICEQGGTLYEFAWRDFAAMVDKGSGLAKLVWEQNT